MGIYLAITKCVYKLAKKNFTQQNDICPLIISHENKHIINFL